MSTTDDAVVSACFLCTNKETEAISTRSEDLDGGRRSRLDGERRFHRRLRRRTRQSPESSREGNGFTALVTGLAMLLAALIARQRVPDTSPKRQSVAVGTTSSRR